MRLFAILRLRISPASPHAAVSGRRSSIFASDHTSSYASLSPPPPLTPQPRLYAALCLAAPSPTTTKSSSTSSHAATPSTRLSRIPRPLLHPPSHMPPRPICAIFLTSATLRPPEPQQRAAPAPPLRRRPDRNPSEALGACPSCPRALATLTTARPGGCAGGEGVGRNAGGEEGLVAEWHVRHGARYPFPSPATALPPPYSPAEPLHLQSSPVLLFFSFFLSFFFLGWRLPLRQGCCGLHDPQFRRRHVVPPKKFSRVR